jgi:hypothetical protein
VNGETECREPLYSCARCRMRCLRLWQATSSRRPTRVPKALACCRPFFAAGAYDFARAIRARRLRTSHTQKPAIGQNCLLPCSAALGSIRQPQPPGSAGRKRAATVEPAAPAVPAVFDAPLMAAGRSAAGAPPVPVSAGAPALACKSGVVLAPLDTGRCGSEFSQWP